MTYEEIPTTMSCEHYVWNLAKSKYIKTTDSAQELSPHNSISIRGVKIEIATPSHFQDPNIHSPQIVFTRPENLSHPMTIGWQYTTTDQGPTLNTIGQSIMRTQPHFSLEITPDLSPIRIFANIEGQGSHPDLYQLTSTAHSIGEGGPPLK